MKKYIALLICLSIFTSSYIISFAEEKTILESIEYEKLAVSSDGDIATVSDDGLKIYDAQGAQLAHIADQDFSDVFEAWSGNRLWVYHITSKTAQCYDRLGNDLEPPIQLPGVSDTAYKMIATDKSLIFLLEFYPQYNNIQAVYLESYEVTVPAIQNALAISPMPNGNIVIAVQDNEVNSIIEYDVLNDVEIERITSPISPVQQICMDTEYTLYFASFGTVYRGYFDESVTPIPIYYYEKDQFSPELFPVRQSVYLWLEDLRKLSIVSKDNTPDFSYLDVFGGQYILEAAAIFESENPGVIIRHELNDSTGDEFMIKMMAQDDSVDIFIVPSDRQGIRQIIDKGYYVDLYSSEIISNDAESWYPRLLELSSIDGKLFGYPLDIYGRALLYDPVRAGEIGLSTDPVNSWKELSDRIENIGDKRVPIYQAYEYFHHEFLLNQCLSAFDIYDEEASKALLSDFINALTLNPDDAFITNDWESLMSIPVVIRLDYAHYIADNYKNCEVLPLPSLVGEPEAPIVVWWILINPYSAKKDLAIKFIEEHIACKSEGVAWMQYQTDQVFDEEMFDEGAVEVMNKVSNALSDYYIAEWHYPIAEVTPIEVIIDQYLSGVLTAQQGIDALYDKICFILEEQSKNSLR